MDPTTLVTFLFKAPPAARVVELLGSWDNFSHAYPMHHDRRRGAGSWTGCFRFQDIIFDGDRSRSAKPRQGGLKQGGTYWYYYRINDQIEAYDDKSVCTDECPLLPGQMVNVMDVPVEMIEPPTRCRSACSDPPDGLASEVRTHTLDPGDKFAALEPPPMSRVHWRCVSDLALSGRLEQRGGSGGLVSPPDSSESKGPKSSASDQRPKSRRRLNPKLWFQAGQESTAPRETPGYQGIPDIAVRPSTPVSIPSTAVSEASSAACEEVAVRGGEFDDFFNPHVSRRHDNDDLADSPPDRPDSETRPPTSRSMKQATTDWQTQFDARSTTLPQRTNPPCPSFPPPPIPHRPTAILTTRETDDDAFSSPTFSDATVSSPGIQTPFRLSAECPPAVYHDETSPSETETYSSAPIDDETASLGPLLGPEPPKHNATPIATAVPAPPQRAPPPPPPPITQPSEPDSSTTPAPIQPASDLDSQLKLPRVSSTTPADRLSFALATGSPAAAGEERIFSELGYLGGMIG